MSEQRDEQPQFKPYVEDDPPVPVAELTPKAIVIGAVFGVIFGASTVYLALRAGLTVSASIPIAVLSISLLKRLGGSTILENNIVQTIGSAGESIAAGVVFTLPGFLFLARDPAGVSVGESFFSYGTIFTLALLGGVLGILMMIPLRRPLIVNEHGALPYPEGTACAQVLIAGEKGGSLARTAYGGLGFAFAYAMLQKVLGVIAESPTWMSSVTSRVFPAATVAADVTPEYMGVGYILGIENGGLLVGGGVLAWLGLIPLLASVVPSDTILSQLAKLGYNPASYGYDAATHQFAQLNLAIYFAYVRQIGAGAVAAGGFITLIKTIPTIVSAFKGSLGSMRKAGAGEARVAVRRTERDLPMSVVIGGSLALIVIIALLPFIPGTNLFGKVLLGVMMIVFGFFFVTVSSRIVGIIGTSSNPISGMTIATLMATCLLFVSFGWTSDVYQPMALCVGGMVCIAAANAGATSQDLKTGFIVGSTPRHQQVGLLIGAVAASLAIGVTIKVLDNAHLDPQTGLVVHAIGGAKLPAPQGTLMATLIKGLLAHNLDWQFVLTGVFLAVTLELCNVRSLAFAVGAYLPLSTTLPIFIGGLVRWVADKRIGAKGGDHGAEDELGPGNLFSTGLVAGGALAGVIYAMLAARMEDRLEKLSFAGTLTQLLGDGGYQLLGAAFFAVMGIVLYRVATRARAKV